jgi:hypothetical protein
MIRLVSNWTWGIDSNFNFSQLLYYKYSLHTYYHSTYSGLAARCPIIKLFCVSYNLCSVVNIIIVL